MTTKPSNIPSETPGHALQQGLINADRRLRRLASSSGDEDGEEQVKAILIEELVRAGYTPSRRPSRREAGGELQ